MKNNYFSIVLVATAFFLIQSLYAQPVNNVVKASVMATPNAASLGKYGDIPVNLSTGVPDISIPITTVQEGPLSMNISLSYHASGIKIAEPASWVGLGWALNAGGAISRTVQALPDEGGTGNLGYYSDPTPVPYPMTGPQVDDYSTFKDPEPDIFSFNVGGYAGKFYFNKDRTISLVPKQDLKISVNFTAGKFYWFLIVSPDGTKYFFGATPADGSTNTAREESTADDPAALSTSSWYLRKIESQDGLYSITLNYLSESYSFKSPASCEQKYVACAANGGGSYANSWNCSNNSANNDAVHFYNYILTKGKRLFSINSTTSTITFDTIAAYRSDLEPYLSGQLNGSKFLDKITVKQTATICSEFRMSYDYFTDPAHTTLEGKRLRLLNVKEVSCDGTIEKPPFTFTYQGSIIRWRLSHSVDHWGFYNGAANEGLAINVPPTTVNINSTPFSFGSANRESVEGQMMDGMLTKIDYPTGGNTQFTFEANDYPTSETYGYRQYSVQVSNCTYPHVCCGTQTVDSTHTFTATELSGARYYFDLFNPTCANSGQPVCTPQFPMTATLYVYQGTTLIHTPIVISLYSTTPPTCRDTIGGYLNTLLNNLQPGIAYKFRVTGTNGKGNFQIYKNATGTNYINQKIGGLRVAQIKSSDGVDLTKDIIKTYQYKNSTNASSGTLFYKPTYGYGFSVYGTGVAYFRDNSIIPMSGFESYHVGYTRVTELLNGNGKTVHDFYIEPMTGTAFSFPVVPEPARLQNGFETLTITAAQDGSVLINASNSLHNDSYVLSGGGTNNRIKIINIPVGNCSGTFALKVSSAPYSMRTRFSRPGSTNSWTDGVISSVTFAYDPSLSYAGATKQTMVNSDNVSTVTEMKYPWTTGYTSPNSLAATIDSLKKHNIIGTPLETVLKVNNVQVDGQRVDYALFQKTTGFKATSGGSDVQVYPNLYSRYEATFDASGNVSIGAIPWETQDEISQYYGTGTAGQGYPYVWTKAHWPSETYEWETSGRLKKRTYVGFVKEYTWLPGTRLLQQFKNIDGQLVNYTYDKLSRLATVSARGGKVTSAYTYIYKAGTTPAYVKSVTTYNPVAGSALNVQELYQYIDGLGRAIETVGKKQSPTLKDVVSVTEYDKWGRVSKGYNAFETATNTGAYVPNSSIPVGTPYILNEYYSDPLNRHWKTTPPAWYATTYQYGTNTASEVKLDHAAGTYYAAAKLMKTTVTNPDGKQITIFKDLKSRTLLIRRTDGTNSAETYNQYDNKNRLKLVIPPGALYNSTDLAFAYTYDEADNMLTKKVPDAALVTMKYNDRDQLALEQDGNLLALNKWRCFQYDSYGRPLKNGLFTGTIPNPILPTLSPTDLYTENTYDGTLLIERGKLKKMRVKEFDVSGTWLETNILYDVYGRDSIAIGNNQLLPSDLSSEIVAYSYDFADHILQDVRTTKKTASINYTVTQNHDYDEWGRLKTNKHKVNSGTQVTISDLNYDWKNQIIEKNLGKTASLSYLQSLDYTYNAQGWLQSINQPTLNTGSNVALAGCPTNYTMPNPAAGANPDANDLFCLDLKYDVLQSGLSGTLQKNGNISQVIWRSRGRERQAYTLSYDFLERMKTATYADINDVGTANSANTYQENLSYDARGNITSLQRNGLYKTTPAATCWTPAQIDNLTYTYNTGTNRLQKIADAAPAASRASGWNNVMAAPSTSTYLYDANGNMTYDPYKGFSVTYNFLNLPIKMLWVNSSTDAEQTIDILYDGSGRKLRKTVTDGGTLIYKQDYINGIEYRTTTAVSLSLESIYHVEGRVFNTNVGTAGVDAFRCEYSIKDHLGNTRLTFADKNGDGMIQETNTAASEVLQENHYYPFGLSLAGAWMDDVAAKDNQYLYNGKEFNTDFGLGWYDYGARWYDPSVGRFSKIDRFSEKYSSFSPYQYAANNPILTVDINGDSLWVSNKGQTYLYEGGKLYQNGAEYTGKLTGFLKHTVKALDRMGKAKSGMALVSSLQSSKNNFTIKHASENPTKQENWFKPDNNRAAFSNQLLTDPSSLGSSRATPGGSGGTIYWDPSGSPLVTSSGVQISAITDLAHEMSHALDSDRGLLDDRMELGVKRSEWQAVYRENVLRDEMGLPLRTHYIKQIDPSGNVLGGTGPLMTTPTNKPLLPIWYKP